MLKGEMDICLYVLGLVASIPVSSRELVGINTVTLGHQIDSINVRDLTM
jgi:hypothetical protein